MVEGHVPQGLEVQVLSRALDGIRLLRRVFVFRIEIELRYDRVRGTLPNRAILVLITIPTRKAFEHE